MKASELVEFLADPPDRRAVSSRINCDQFGSVLLGRPSHRVVEHLRVDVHVGSTLAWPIDVGTTLAGTPLSCAQDEYVRRNVSQDTFGSSSALAAATMGFSTLFGEIDLPDHVDAIPEELWNSKSAATA